MVRILMTEAKNIL